MIRDYDNSVFINCPFDLAYKNKLAAIIFTAYKCGFAPITALREDNALEIRLSKIITQIESCRFGIHDVSRVEFNPEQLPRFNMPFELGLFFGAKNFGNKSQRSNIALVFEGQPYSYQKVISDLNGVDVNAHKNNVDNIIRLLRNWFSTNSNKNIPGYTSIIKEFKYFRQSLKFILFNSGLNWKHVSYNNLLSGYRRIPGEYLQVRILTYP